MLKSIYFTHQLKCYSSNKNTFKWQHNFFFEKVNDCSSLMFKMFMFNQRKSFFFLLWMEIHKCRFVQSEILQIVFKRWGRSTNFDALFEFSFLLWIDPNPVQSGAPMIRNDPFCSAVPKQKYQPTSSCRHSAWVRLLVECLNLCIKKYPYISNQ